MAKTTQILRLTCTHDYFSGSIEGLQLQPTRETQRWISSHRILMRSMPTAITLYKTDETPENYKELLTFLLMVDDAQFYNYTLLPVVSVKDQLCYLSDKDGSLSENSSIKATNFHNKIYAITPGEDAIREEEQLRVTDQSGTTVVETRWDGNTPLMALLNNLPPGKYNWTYGDRKGSFFGAPETIRKGFGLIEIDLKTAENITYNIHFNVRESFWEYYVIDKQQTDNRYEIVDEDKQYQFDAPEQTEVLGGKRALKIVSKDPIPFKQQPDYEFKLITKVSSGRTQPWNGTILLPKARTEHLQVSGKENAKYRTPIYIYI